MLDAERALAIEELEMTWRYSVGNAYEELSYAEALDVAQVMAGYGYGDVARQILRYTLEAAAARASRTGAPASVSSPARSTSASTATTRYVAEETPALAPVVDRLARELAASRTGLLPRERYSSDIADEIYSLQGQTLVWQGLLAMSRVWAETGHAALAARCRLARRAARDAACAARCARRSGGLPTARSSSRRRCSTARRRSAQLTASRDGTYWNLVVPYALASGFFAPHGAEANGLLRYLLRHGSRLLGLVRAGAYRLAGCGRLGLGHRSGVRHQRRALPRRQRRARPARAQPLRDARGRA